MKKALLVFVFAVCAFAQESVVWDFSKPQVQWSGLRNATAVLVEGATCVSTLARDASIVAKNLSYDPKLFSHIRFTVRYEGFETEDVNGQLYFGTEAKPSLSDAQAIYFKVKQKAGQKQVITLAFKDVRGGNALWYQGGKVTTLRFDFADQHPGKVYIEKIELLSKAAMQTQTVYDFSKGPQGWTIPYNMKITPEANALKLDVTGTDCRLMNNNVCIDIEKFKHIKITYSAEGFADGNKGGEIFYASSEFNAYGKGGYVGLPQLITDGQDHEMFVNAPWKGFGIVFAVRLDLTNAFPGVIHLKKVEFLP